MADIVYEVVEHDGGWAYRVGDAYSETFASYDQARAAAERAAREQQTPGDSERSNTRMKRATGAGRPPPVLAVPKPPSKSMAKCAEFGKRDSGLMVRGGGGTFAGHGGSEGNDNLRRS